MFDDYTKKPKNLPNSECRLVTPYLIDPGLARSFTYGSAGDRGWLLENSVYLELRRRGYSANYVVTESGFLVDFIARRAKGDAVSTACQASSKPGPPASMDSTSPRSREAKGFSLANMFRLLGALEGRRQRLSTEKGAMVHEDMATKAKDLMTPAVITVTSDQTTGEVRDLMLSHDIHAIPVVEGDEKPVGIVTSTDLLSRFEEVMPISRVMSRSVFELSPNATPDEAACMMRAHGAHHLVVTEHGKVSGVLSAFDLLSLIEHPKKSRTRVSKKKVRRK